jgi:MFS transporter, DHA1 family, tetracycline resistance protein
MKNKRLILFSLCLLIFIDSIGVGLIFPIMPELFLDPTYGLIAHEGWIPRNMLYGMAFAFFPLSGFFGMPLLGVLSDQFGRRRMMLIGLMGIVLGYIMSAVSVWTKDSYLFLISRLVEGFFVGTYTIANAAIADMSDGIQSKIDNFKWPILASVFGFILGPFFGSAVGLIDGLHALAIPFLIALILSIVNFIMIYLLFPKDPIDAVSLNDTASKVSSKAWKQLKLITYVFTDKNIKSLSIGYIFFQFGLGLFVQSISILLAINYHYGTGKIGLFFVVMGIGVAFNILVVQPLLKRFVSLNKSVNFSTIIMGSMLLVQCFTVLIDDFVPINTSGIFWVSSCVLYIFLPLASTGYMAVFSESVSKDERGKIMGGVGQIFSLSWFVSALFIGYLVEGHESIILLMASLCLFASVYLFKVFNKKVSYEFN